MDKTAKQLLILAAVGSLTSALVPSLVTSVNWWKEKPELRPTLLVSWIITGLIALSVVDTTRRWLAK